MKRCYACHIKKPDDEFEFLKSRNCYSNRCRECKREYYREYRWKNGRKDDHRPRYLYKMHGLTKGGILQMLREQKFACAICRADIDILSRHVDHDHATGQLRGLLCSNCNLALGLFKDNTDTIFAALKYLERNRECHESIA